VADTDPSSSNVAEASRIPAKSGSPGSTSREHPTDGIPLPAHGFAKLDAFPLPESSDVPAADVITHAATALLNAAADKLGLGAGEPHLELSEARHLITALAGLLAASKDYLGAEAKPLLDGIKTLQAAFREASSYPDEPGQGPGEQLLP